MIYVTGDMHGDFKRFSNPQLKKLKKGDTLIVCGDFGFVWDNSKKEQRILKKIGKLKYNVCFIDGTHENFELLEKYEKKLWKGGYVHNISGNLFHLLRGQVYRIEGYGLFTMGGGESPDIDIRFDNDTWSRREIPSKQELIDGAVNLRDAGNDVDYIITHEPPLKIKHFLRLKENEAVRVTGLNTYFEELSECCTFRRWFFGSMHEDKFVSGTHIAVFQHIVNAETGEILK